MRLSRVRLRIRLGVCSSTAQPPQVFGLREAVGDDGLLNEVLLQQIVQGHEA